MLNLIKRLRKCKIVVINLDEPKNTIMKSDLLKPRAYYRRKIRSL